MPVQLLPWGKVRVGAGAAGDHEEAAAWFAEIGPARSAQQPPPLAVKRPQLSGTEPLAGDCSQGACTTRLGVLPRLVIVYEACICEARVPPSHKPCFR